MSTEVIAAPAPAADEKAAPSALKPVAGFAFAFATAGGAFAIGVGTGWARGTDVTLLALALVTLVVGFAPMILDSGRPRERRSVLLTMLGIPYALQFAVPVLLIYIPAVGPIDALGGLSFVRVMPEDIARAQLLAIVGLLAIYAGHAVPLGRFVRQILPPPRYEWTERGTLVMAVLLITVGGVFYLAGRLGFIPAALGARLVGSFTDLALVAPAVLTACFLRYRTRLSLLMLLVVPAISAFNFLSSSKNLILMPWAMLAVTYIVHTRRVQFRWFLAGFLAVILIFPATAFIRNVVLVGNQRSLAEVLKDPGQALGTVAAHVGEYSLSDYFDEGFDRTTYRMDAIAHPTVILRDTGPRVPFQHGWTIGLLLISWIPRILWPGKPPTTIGIWLNDTYNQAPIYIESHLGPSWIGEFYLNFGTTGIVGGMLFLGLLFRLWHELLSGRGQTIPLMVAEVVLIMQIILHVTGGLMSVVNAPVTTVAPLLLLHFTMRFFGATRPVGAPEAEPPR